MFAGVSGLRSHQEMMDVVGNNISNVNTHGFKSERATFQDALYQTQRGATTGEELDGGGEGGVNPLQIGLGANLASVDTNFGQGSFEMTGRATDVAIDGEGFFVVDTDEGEAYTRAGIFDFDGAGNLVDRNGNTVMGASGEGDIDGEDLEAITIDPDTLSELRDVSVQRNGVISGRDGDGDEEIIGTIATADFTNPGGLERDGGSLFRPTGAEGDMAVGAPGEDGRGALEGGVLEMGNVDLADEFTKLITAQRGFQANSRTITTSDELLQELVNLKR
ncbi:flagellar basal-body rod protein FlgF [Egibacter rhizosphaerae]|nr:flagellar basal-body rod protein FlgF [Egibacter rhizosphaerae]